MIEQNAKSVKGEDWTVKELIQKINQNLLTKPRFQRRKKWDVSPKRNNIPNERDYINFLRSTLHTVQAITFSKNDRNIFSNIDGNNRINAIQHYIDKPFEIFPNELDELLTIFKKNKIKNSGEIETVFKCVSYKEFLQIATLEEFLVEQKDKKELYDQLSIFEKEIIKSIRNIQKRIKINSEDSFDAVVKINVNIFTGYTTDELANLFESINKYNSKLTATELLACHLNDKTNFSIDDIVFKTELEQSIKDYYEKKSEGEVLICYKFDSSDKITGHDFIVGFQNLCSSKYDFIQVDEIDGLSLFFKLYRACYGSFDESFTNNNVKDFSEKIYFACDILKKTISRIFTDKIDTKLFNKNCKKKIKSLKKNNLFIIIACIIGYNKKGEEENKIINEIEICLLYHFMINDLKSEREKFDKNDKLAYRASGGVVEKDSSKLLKEPEIINENITKESFSDLINELCKQTNNPYDKSSETSKNSKTRYYLFFEKILWFYYYKEKIPINLLENTFEIEHIVPKSSDWDGMIDINRTGNLIPIVADINKKRSNKHISEYNKSHNRAFCEYINEIIPNNDEYDNIVIHKDKKPQVKNTQKYDFMCTKNEKTYGDWFCNELFKLKVV